MHPQAAAFITACVTEGNLQGADVLDLGGRVVFATSIHHLFFTKPTVVDIEPGDGVDIVADAATWTPNRLYDCVLCTEVFEHTPEWRDIIQTAHTALKTGGTFITTMASRDRPPHSGNDGGPLPAGEYYQNIDPVDLCTVMTSWAQYSITATNGAFGNDDLYCMAVK